MAEFDRSIASAKRMIQKKGQLVQWRKLSDGIPADPSKPWLPSAGGQVDTDVYICFVPVKDRATRLFFAHMTGREVAIGSLAGLMAGDVAFEPSLKDVVIRSGVQLAIDSIDLLSPNGQKVLYTIEFKG